MYKLDQYYGKFDLVYSGGVVEHLEEGKVIHLFKEQAKTAKYVFVVIPTRYEYEDSPYKRYPYTINDLVNFGNKAGLKKKSVIDFHDINSPLAYFLKNFLSLFLYKWLQVQFSYSRRIGVVFKTN